MALIDLKNVSKKFSLDTAEVIAVQDVSLSVNQGEFVAIMGPSGSGKSTLMNIIGLLDHPTSGEYKLDDQIVSTSMGDRAQARLRSEFIGFIFQTFNLLPNLDVLANVELPATYMLSGNLSAKKRATELLNTVGLDHRLHHRPNQLSGGERQRVAIARALMNQPSIILADEPTGNLDSKSGDEIIGLLQELNKKGTTLLLVTHNDDLAKKAGKIIRMKDGRIV